MKLYVFCAMLRKPEGIQTKMTIMQGYRGAENEDEARGRFIAKVMEEKPDYDISQLLVLEIPAEDIAKFAPANGG